MEVDNFDLIRLLLDFKSDDEFYFLQILKRKKENPEQIGNSKEVKTYYITSLEQFNQKEEEIKNLCKITNSRAYINLNKRSFEKCALLCLKQVTDCIINDNFKSVRKAYTTVCGYQHSGDKIWVVDCDDMTADEVLELGIKIKSVNQQPIVAYVPTINGYHILCKPFNTLTLQLNLDIQKNNPTLLYYGR